MKIDEYDVSEPRDECGAWDLWAFAVELLIPTLGEVLAGDAVPEPACRDALSGGAVCLHCAEHYANI